MSQPAGAHSRIAYINNRGQLCTIEPEGSRHRLLTASRRKRAFHFPAWSPDGNHLAVIGRTKDSAGVFVLPVFAAGTSDVDVPRALHIDYTERPFYLYWSPDSQVVSFLAAHPQGLGLHLIGCNGQHHRLLTTGQPCFWAWAPGSDELLIHTGGNGSTGRLQMIHVHNARARAEDFARPGLFQTPVIAPSGQHWAFAEETPGGGTFVVVSSGPHVAHIRVSIKGAVALGWSPVHDHLAFMSPPHPARHFYGPLYLLNMHTQDVQTLSSDVVLGFFWAPDGQHIAYLTLARGLAQNIPPTTGYTNGHATNGNGHHPPHMGRFLDEDTLSPLSDKDDPLLNLWVANIHSGQCRMLTTFQPSEEFLTQFLPFFDQYALSHCLWSPASDALVLPVNHRSGVHVMVVPLDGSPARPIAEGNMAFWSPAQHPTH